MKKSSYSQIEALELPHQLECELVQSPRAERIIVSAISRGNSSQVYVSEHFTADEAVLALEIAESLGIPVLEDSGLARLIRALPCNTELDQHLLEKIAQIAQKFEAWWLKQQSAP